MPWKKQRFEAESLSEFMQLMKSEHLEQVIFRGEDRKYPAIVAAAFRQGSGLDIGTMVEEFKNYIGNELTELQKEHFLAFSQHYGLPTNLLDFTFSPLVALFFACQGEESETGYVYYLRKERLISLTGKVDLMRAGLFTGLCYPDAENQAVYEEVSRLFCVSSGYLGEFLRCVDHMIGDRPGNEEIRRVLRGTIKKVERDEEESIELLDPVIKVLHRRLLDFEKFWEMPGGDLGAVDKVFVYALRLLLFQGYEKDGFYLPFYFTYEPANITSRVPNQSSLLIYQLYGLNSLKQKIRPDGEIRIRNKGHILEELDQMGINEKFIFNDYDHIAAYIKKKHLKKAAVQQEKLEKLKKMAEALL